MQNLKNGSCRVCIATDVASRGIDIIDLDIVIHANLPRNSETLIHRSGRTGRAGKRGLSIIIFSPSNVKSYNRVIEQAKIFPKLKKNLSRKIIEDNENSHFLKKISDISKSNIDNKLVKELIEQYSSTDLAKAIVSIYKSDLSPIEEIEDIEFNVNKKYKKEKFKFSKLNPKDKFKRNRRKKRN